MKKEHFILAAFLFVVFGLFVSIFQKVFDIRTPLIQAIQTREILSNKFVAENVLPAENASPETDSYIFNNVHGRIPPQMPQVPPRFDVLGSATGYKKIVVDLSKQRVYAYQDGQLVFNFLVSTGKWGATPVGNYRIWYKVRSQTMKGGNPALGTYYYLPNVQWIQYFNQGIGFHSTYWHNNFGTPMSHGCVNMTTTDAETLYHWASPVMLDGVRIFRSSSDNPGTEVEVVQNWVL